MRTSSTESELRAAVCRAVEGDRVAIDHVVRAVQPLVSRLALRFFGCPQHAQDATQEALLLMVQKLDRFQGHSAFTTWLYRLATNKFLSMARSPAERDAMSFEAFDEDLSRPTEPAPEPAAEPDHQLMLAEVRIGCTLAMLLCLERESRMAYILGEIAELEHAAASEILGCTPASYRKRLERARAAVTGLMRRRCGVFDADNHCNCADRIPIAKAKGYLDPERLIYATSADQARLFPEVLHQIRRLEKVQRAAAIYQSHPDPSGLEDVATRLHEALRSGEAVVGQG